MKPLGQKPHKRNFTDVRPPKGTVNWWEVEGCDENKAAENEAWKKEVEEILLDNQEFSE